MGQNKGLGLHFKGDVLGLWAFYLQMTGPDAGKHGYFRAIYTGKHENYFWSFRAPGISGSGYGLGYSYGATVHGPGTIGLGSCGALYIINL